MAINKSALKIGKLKENIQWETINLLLLESGEECGTHHIF